MAYRLDIFTYTIYSNNLNRFENKRHLNIYETTEDFSSLFQGGESKKREKKISYIVERKT